jgi:hypothetical protein
VLLLGQSSLLARHGLLLHQVKIQARGLLGELLLIVVLLVATITRVHTIIVFFHDLIIDKLIDHLGVSLLLSLLLLRLLMLALLDLSSCFSIIASTVIVMLRWTIFLIKVLVILTVILKQWFILDIWILDGFANSLTWNHVCMVVKLFEFRF